MRKRWLYQIRVKLGEVGEPKGNSTFGRSSRAVVLYGENVSANDTDELPNVRV